MYTAVAPPDQTDADSSEKAVRVGESPPAGVSESNWKKFQELKKRREQCCKKSTEKRKRERRNKVIKPVSSQQKDQDELSILKEYGITASQSDKVVHHGDSSSGQARRSQNSRNEAKWKDLKQFLPHNSKLESHDKSVLRKQTEEEIDKAINKGQYEKAESLSEQLTTQDFVVKVASAVKGRDFSKRRCEEQTKAQKSKKTKLHWGFEQKQRWESKGNM